jgi:integrase
MVQKKEKRIFDMLPESETTFSQLGEWYLALKPLKKLASYSRIEGALSNFNSVFGNRTVDEVKRTDLENYQEQRLEAGIAPATVDMELSIAKTMVTRAFDDDKIGGDVLKAFRTVKKKLKKGSNARTRTITIDEYKGLIKESPTHLRTAIVIGFNTGMRLGEIRKLKWIQVDRKAGLIRLTETDTKEGKPKAVPINHHVKKLLNEIPRALNGFVITYEGQPIRGRNGLKRSFKTACKNAGIPCGRGASNGITFHDLRRTVKTNLARAGVSKVYRDKLLGHAPQGMDAHYMALDEDDLRGAMDQYTAWLDNQLTSVDQTVDQEQERVS